MILSVVFYINYPSSSSHYWLYYQIIDNWNTDFIIDLKVILPTDNCTSDYEPLLQYKFEGTIEGCDCTKATVGTSGIKQQVYAESCSSLMLSKSCQKVSSIPSEYLSVWQDNNQNSFRLCGKRYSGLNYAAIGSHLNCNSKQKLCKGYYQGQGICVPNSVSCPINYINFSSISNAESITNNSVTISYSRSFNRPPLTNMIAALGSGVCLDRSIESIPASYNYNGINLFEEQDTFCSQVDNRLVKINNISIFTYQSINALYTKLSAISGFENESSTEYRSYEEFNIGWTQSCRKNLLSIATETKNVFQFIYKCDKWLMITSIIYFVVVGIGMMTCGCYKVMSFQENQEQQLINPCGIIYYNIFFTLVQGSAIIISYWKSLRMYNFFSDVINKQCTDSFTLSIFESVYHFCLLYTSDAADDMQCVDLGGRRIIKKKKTLSQSCQKTTTSPKTRL
eukprot:TRINITY_DN31582_c0_g1_i2.p1 TRINITY_DN31582_c0_g1~~TRINITY_DN31582_c0_g1_i2.p1  ORF type:complete len:452 (+),score=32.85 TRINITY_DN31582_c0_g1_i2:3-1358(+)